MRRSFIVCLALVLSLPSLFVGSVAAQEASPGVDSPAANEALVRRFYEAVNAHDLTAFDELLAPDVVDHNPSTADQPPGREGVRDAITQLLTGFPDFEVTNEDVIAAGDKVVVRSTVRGTHTGEFVGIPPTGKQFEFRAIDIHRVASGQIVEIWHVEELLSLLMQLGVIPSLSAPAPSSAAATMDHPLTGSWIIDSDAEDPANPPALVIFGADGTLIELHEGEPDGAGIWTALDGETAAATIVFHSVDEELALEGTATVQATVAVTGDTFTAPYTITFTAPDGTVAGTEEGTATATRIGSEPLPPAGTPVD